MFRFLASISTILWRMRLSSTLLLASYSWLRNCINCGPRASSTSCSEMGWPATTAAGLPGDVDWPNGASGKTRNKDRLSNRFFIVFDYLFTEVCGRASHQLWCLMAGPPAVYCSGGRTSEGEAAAVIEGLDLRDRKDARAHARGHAPALSVIAGCSDSAPACCD